MSGTYETVNETAPGGLADTRAAVAAGLAEAVSAFHVTQVEAATFMREHGAAVVPGHADVNQPGRMGDPDIERDASD
jgi:hypothetical protein